MLTFIIFAFAALALIGIASAVISFVVAGLATIMTTGFYFMCVFGYVLLAFEQCWKGCKWIGRKIALGYNKIIKK